MALHQRLAAAWRHTDSMLCVGLDPDTSRFPDAVGGSVFEFCREIVDATADVSCAVKPQIAYFAALGAEGDLERLCAHVRDRHPHLVLVLDAKRGDIGSTAEQYAREAFDRYGAHAVTVNPYMGGDTIEPFLRHRDGGVFVLCRTSNPGSGDFQSLEVDGEPLYLRVARRVAEWNRIGDCGLVVGATYPAELAAVRAAVGDLPLDCDLPEQLRLAAAAIGAARSGDPAAARADIAELRKISAALRAAAFAECCYTGIAATGPSWPSRVSPHPPTVPSENSTSL